MNNRGSTVPTTGRPQILPPVFVLLLVAVTAGRAAAAADADLLRCRALAGRDARLACYDSVPLSGGAAAARPPDRSAPGGPAAPPAQGATGPATAAAATTAQAGTSVAAQVASFGLQRPDPVEPVSEIVSSLPGSFEGWGPRTRFTLANGQVWQVSDDSTAVYRLKDPQVKVRRGVLSGFVMDIEGARRSPRVQRVE